MLFCTHPLVQPVSARYNYRLLTIPLELSSILRKEFTIPNCIHKSSYCPSGVTNAVLYTSSGATSICQCQYPFVKSILDMYFMTLSRQNRSSSVIMGSGSTSVILFNFLTHSVRNIFLLNHDYSHFKHTVHFIP